MNWQESPDSDVTLYELEYILYELEYTHIYELEYMHMIVLCV
jgi:hypothetical protein